MRVARESLGRRERGDRAAVRRGRAQIARLVPPPLARDEPLEIGETVGSHRGEPGRRRGVAVVEQLQPPLEVGACLGHAVRSRIEAELRGHDLAVARRLEDDHAFARDDVEVLDDVLLREVGVNPCRSRRRGHGIGEPVEAGSDRDCGCGPDEAATSEAHPRSYGPGRRGFSRTRARSAAARPRPSRAAGRAGSAGTRPAAGAHRRRPASAPRRPRARRAGS